jgi:uncharacterized protein YecT (DUF1311 family)
MRIRAAVASALLVALLPLKEASSSSEYECGTVPGSTAENECIDRRVKALDVELNKTYRLALSQLPRQSNQDIREEKRQLRLSQQAWLKYRDENCALLGSLEGGMGQTVIFNTLLCLEHETKERIEFLKGIANASKP